MTATNEAILPLPPIPIRDLGPETKDFLIANAASGKTPGELMIGLLERAATEAGFPAEPETVKEAP